MLDCFVSLDPGDQQPDEDEVKSVISDQRSEETKCQDENWPAGASREWKDA